MTWLDKQIKDLLDTSSKFKSEIQKIENIDPNICNDFEEATPLKLIFFNYTLNIYSSIIHKYIQSKKFFENMFYIDMFAGTGLNRLRSNKDTMIGSPFIAILNHKDKFTKLFFCENNVRYNTTLLKRINALGVKNCEISQEDCNKSVDDVLSKITKVKNSHSFFFIDPYALDFTWESMEKVLNCKCDILFTFMTNSINRARNAAFALPSNKSTVLDNFFGKDSWKSAERDVADIYSENIMSVRPNALIQTVRIDKYYDLMFITKKTKGNNQWMRGLHTAKKEIESNSKEAVKIALDKLKRGQRDLNIYYET